METLIRYRRSYKYLMSIYKKRSFMHGLEKGTDYLSSSTMIKLERYRKRIGRWSLHTDACRVCGKTKHRHYSEGFCKGCEVRLRELDLYSRKFTRSKNFIGKATVIFYMPSSTNSKTIRLSQMLGTNKNVVEEMAIDFLYDFLIGYLPKASKEHGLSFDVSSDGIMKLMFRLRSRILLEGTKAMIDLVNDELDTEKKTEYANSYIPGYSQVGGAILTSMHDKKRM